MQAALLALLGNEVYDPGGIAQAFCMSCNHFADLEKGTECDIAFHERVNACHEVALFLLPAKYSIKSRCRYLGRSNSLGKPGLCLRFTDRSGIRDAFDIVRNSGLALRCCNPCRQAAIVTGLTVIEKEGQRCSVGVAEHVDFGCEAAATAAYSVIDRHVRPLFPAGVLPLSRSSRFAGRSSLTHSISGASVSASD